MPRVNILLTLVFAVIFSVCIQISDSFAEGEDFVGKASPEFIMIDLDENKITNESVKGKPVLINFWGLRCGACIEEMPHLNDLYDKYKDDGLILLGINADGIDADFLKGPRGMPVLPFKIKYTVIQDPDMKLIDLFKMEAAPLNVLIDKEGVIRYYHVGYEPGDEKALEERVKSIIK